MRNEIMPTTGGVSMCGRRYTCVQDTTSNELVWLALDATDIPAPYAAANNTCNYDELVSTAHRLHECDVPPHLYALTSMPLGDTQPILKRDDDTYKAIQFFHSEMPMRVETSFRLTEPSESCRNTGHTYCTASNLVANPHDTPFCSFTCATSTSPTQSSVDTSAQMAHYVSASYA
jgi:hypothetical protein